MLHSLAPQVGHGNGDPGTLLSYAPVEQTQLGSNQRPFALGTNALSEVTLTYTSVPPLELWRAYFAVPFFLKSHLFPRHAIAGVELHVCRRSGLSPLAFLPNLFLRFGPHFVYCPVRAVALRLRSRRLAA